VRSRLWTIRSILLPLALSFSACSSSSPAPDLTADLGRGDAPSPTDLRREVSGDRSAADLRAPDTTRADFAMIGNVSCKTQPPSGATLAPAPPAYSGGTCPTLSAGMNTIASKGGSRKFILVLPSTPAAAGERFPLLFMWHWLAGNAKDFFEVGEVQAAVDQQRFVAVIPEAKGDLDLYGLTTLPWPILKLQSDPRFEEEVAFFDDLLACVSQQQPIEKECVASAGVSAGALFTMQLVGARSGYLSSFISLSGGISSPIGANNQIRPFGTPVRKLPGLVLWGGPYDRCALIDFQVASLELETTLQQSGAFFVECIHNCKHAEPPVTPPAGESRYGALWDFFLKHPFWLPTGQSPYHQNGLPAKATIPWCGIGPGSATPRTGDCPPPACPF
jgi:predicted esterase